METPTRTAQEGYWAVLRMEAGTYGVKPPLVERVRGLGSLPARSAMPFRLGRTGLARGTSCDLLVPYPLG